MGIFCPSIGPHSSSSWEATRVAQDGITHIYILQNNFWMEVTIGINPLLNA